MYTKKNGRVTFKSNRRTGYKRNNFSNSKGKNKGNITQQYNKYFKLAKEAHSSGDRIQAEYYYQFTDHYYRLMAELGINLEENSNTNENKFSEDRSNEDLNNAQNQESVDEKKENEDENEDSKDSIESVPFLSEPAKKKRSRSTK